MAQKLVGIPGDDAYAAVGRPGICVSGVEADFYLPAVDGAKPSGGGGTIETQINSFERL